MDRVLHLKFKTDNEKVKYTLQVKHIKDTLNAETVKPAITAILAANCIKYKGARLVECISAEIVSKTVTEFTI